MEVRWSQRSLKKVLKISEFISEDSKKRALKFITELTNSVDRLKDFPESGPVIIENPAFRQITFKKCRIIYRLKTDYIEIVTVVSPKQELKI